MALLLGGATVGTVHAAAQIRSKNSQIGARKQVIPEHSPYRIPTFNKQVLSDSIFFSFQ